MHRRTSIVHYYFFTLRRVWHVFSLVINIKKQSLANTPKLNVFVNEISKMQDIL